MLHLAHKHRLLRLAAEEEKRLHESLALARAQLGEAHPNVGRLRAELKQAAETHQALLLECGIQVAA
jgi:hypothetical protein